MLLKTAWFRQELRYALLAAMETCWVYAILMFLSAVTGTGHTLSAPALFLAYWIALTIGRLLPRTWLRWDVQQAITVGLVVVTMLILVRVELYPNTALADPSWLSNYLGALVGLRVSAVLIATVALIYVFARGLGFGQRPLTLWFMGFQFRLGIVAFFTVFLLSGFLKPIDAGRWIFLFFALALFAIALARIEEMGIEVQFSARWWVILLGAVVLVLFLGAAILEVFTLETANLAVKVIAVPVGLILGIAFMILVIPASYLVGWLVDWLRPALANSEFDRFLQSLGASGMDSPTGQLQNQPPWLDALLPALRMLFVAALVLGGGVLLARSLNRRMGEIEHETYLRESMGAEEEDARLREQKRHRRGHSGTYPGHVSAASVRRMYAALVAHAARAGVARRAAETPYELLPRLEQAFPEQAEPINVITQAYIAVHYGEQDAEDAEVDRVRKAWSRVQRSIRRKR